MSGWNLPDGCSVNDLPGDDYPETCPACGEPISKPEDGCVDCLGPEVDEPDPEICDEFYDGN